MSNLGSIFPSEVICGWERWEAFGGKDPCPAWLDGSCFRQAPTLRVMRPLTNPRALSIIRSIPSRIHVKRDWDSHLQSFVVCLVQFALRSSVPNSGLL